jgi:hypothetical protein
MNIFELPRSIHTKEQSSSKLGWVESWSKMLIPITAIFYAIGLLSINAYLDKIGASEFSLVRYQAALIGIWALVPLLFGVVLTRILLWCARELWTHVRILYRRRHVLTKSELTDQLIRGVNLIVMISAFVLAGTLVARDVPDSEDAWMFFFSSVSIIVFGQLLVWGLTHKPRPTKISPPNSEFEWFTEVAEDPRVWAPYPIIMVLLSAFLYINLFGTYVYPVLPQSIGGAKPRDVQILLAREDTSIATLLGIPTVAGGRLSTPVKLLYLAGDQVYVRVTGESVIQIDRKHINGICIPKVEVNDDESRPTYRLKRQVSSPATLKRVCAH